MRNYPKHSLFFLLLAFHLIGAVPGDFSLADANPSQGNGGNITLEVCSPSEPPGVSFFNFWVNNIPVGISEANFSQCRAGVFGNNESDFLSVNTTPCVENPPSFPVGPGQPYKVCAQFALNVSWTDGPIVINASVNNTPGDDPLMSRTWTLNYLNIKTSIGNAIIMAQDDATKRYIYDGPALTDQYGYYMEHCIGPLTGTLCVPQGPYLGQCAIHGIPFPNTAGCSNGTQKLIFFDFISTNYTSAIKILDDNVPSLYNLTSTITIAMIQPQPFFGQPGEQPVQPQMNLSQIYDEGGNLLYDIPTSGGMGSPAFISPKKKHTIRIRGILNDSGQIMPFDRNYSFMTVDNGMSGAMITLKASNSSTTFIGKVINQSGAAVTNGIVYAQPLWGFTPPMGIGFVNSSFTDGTTGVFKLTVPKNIPYKLVVLSNDTNPSTGSVIYNPTVVTNDGRGYSAQQDVVILPPLTIKNGGTINLEVVLNGAAGVSSELSKVFNLPEGPRRDAFSSRMAPVSIFDTVSPPTSMFLSLVAPVENVLLNIYGINIQGASNGPPPITHVCLNNSFVSQGQISSISCNLNNTPGTLNLEVTDCRDSVFTCLNNQPSRDVWFNSKIVIFDAQSGAVVADVEEGSMAQENNFKPGQEGAIQIKLPAGNYKFAILPKFQWGAPLGIYFSGTAAILPDAFTNITVRRQQRGWEMQPMMPFQMRSQNSNPVAAAVYDFGATPSEILNSTKINLTVQALQLNGSYAGNMSSGIPLQYHFDLKIPGPIVNPGGFNGTFRPSDYGIPAGKYRLLFNATTMVAANSQVHSATYSFPFTISDFDIGVELAKFSWANSETLKGKIFAFLANGSGLSGNATVTFYDFSGLQVGSPSTIVVTDGEGALSIPVSQISSQTGFYEMLVVLNTGSTFGFANNFIQITNFIISTEFDRKDYKPEDVVKLIIGVANSTNSPISNASIEALVDNNQNSTFGSTDASGKATLSLNPITISSSNWTFGFHQIRLKIAYSTATEVIQQETFAGFEVRGFNVQIQPDRPAYQPTDNLTLNIFFGGEPQQPQLLIDDVQTIPASISGNGRPYIVVVVPPNGGWAPGHHQIKFSFTQGSSTQTVYSGFEVNSFNIVATPDKFSYQVGETARVLVKVFDPQTSSPVQNTIVNGTLFKFQQSGDLQVGTNGTSTNTSGIAVLTFNLTKAGFHYVKIIVNGSQHQFVGFLVSGLNLRLSLDRQQYSPGESFNLTINVTGADATGALVSARMFAFGQPTEIPSSGLSFGGVDPYYAYLVYQIPSNAPAITYFLDVKVTLANGDTGFAAIPVIIAGGQKLSLFSDRPFTQPYKVGENGKFTAMLISAGNNTAINGTNVTFEIGSSTGTTTQVGSALTDPSGKAALSVPAASMPTTDGEFYMRVYLAENPQVQAFAGFRVSGLLVTLVSSSTQLTLGQNVTFNVTVLNASTGTNVTPTSGSIVIWDKNRGQLTFPMSISGNQPYSYTLSIPTDANALGTYTAIAVMTYNSLSGMDSILMRVQNASAPVNITLPSSMNASTQFLVNISVGGASATRTAVLRVFSPAASNITFVNNSITFANGNVSVPVNITIPGKYIFMAEVDGYGTATAVGDVTAPTGSFIYRIWTTNDTSGTNSTTFTAGQTAYIWSNAQNTTAVVMTQNATTGGTSVQELPVVIPSGAYNYYTTFSDTVSGQTYFVRLDTSTTAGAATGLFKVT